MLYRTLPLIHFSIPSLLLRLLRHHDMRSPAYQPLTLFSCEQFLGTVRGIHIGRREVAIKITQTLICLDMLLLEFLQLLTGHDDLLDEFLLALVEPLPDRVEFTMLLLRQIQSRNNIQYSGCGTALRPTPSAGAALGGYAARTTLRTAHHAWVTLGTAHTTGTAPRTRD